MARGDALARPLRRARGHPLRPRAVHRHHAPQRDRHPDGRGAGAQLGQHQLRGLRPLRERGLRRAGVRHLRHHARRRRGGDRPRHRARHLPELRDDRRRGDGPAPAMTPAGYVGAIPLVPLAGAAVLGLGGAPLQRRFGKLPVSLLACGTVATSFVLSVVAFFQLAGLAPDDQLLLADLFPWVHVGTLNVDVAFGVDPLSAVMILVVTGIGGLIHLYATGYMHDDPAFWRFFAYLNLFTFAMLTLVLGDNLLLMFVGWEGVGFCSWALIGFWHKELYNTTAGNKAFIVNRIGDFGFVLGLFLLFWTLDARGHGTLVFRELAQHAHLLEGQVFWGLPVATLVTLFLFVGATGKSAQIPLYVWLPDAMAGPTPGLAGAPPLAGFSSKDEILWQAFSSPLGSRTLCATGVLVAGLTAFYMFRQVFMVFFGTCRADLETRHHLHESPAVMTIPLWILMGGSILAGLLWLPFDLFLPFEHWLAPVMEQHGEAQAATAGAGLESLLMLTSLAFAAGGIGLAYRMYASESLRPETFSEALGGLPYRTVLNKSWVDELYH